MKRRDVGFVVAASLAAFLAGCFSDPTSDLRNGPARIVITLNAVTILKGDSIQVQARLADGQGNLLPVTGATWQSADETVAALSYPSDVNPGDNVSKVWIRGVPVQGGITQVHITIRGLADSVRVTVLPNTVFPAGVAAVSGTAQADTTGLGAAFTAGDTLTLTAPSGYQWDAANSVVHLGGVTTYLLSRTSTTLKVIARGPYRGRPAVTKVIFVGDANTGNIVIDSLLADSVNLARARFRGTAAVSTGSLGTNTVLTLTAQSGTTFNTSGSSVTGVLFGSVSPMILSRTASAITVATTRTGGFSGTVQLTNVNVGTTVVDSLRTPASYTLAKAAFPDANVVVRTGTFGTNTEIKVTPPSGTTFSTASTAVLLGSATGTKTVNTADSIVVISTASFTGTVKVTNVVSTGSGGGTLDSLRNTTAISINPSNFPGTVAAKNTGVLLDTVLVIGTTTARLTTSGTSPSNATINGLTAFVLRRAAGPPDTLFVIAKKPGTATVSISNVIVGTTTISSLSTSGTLAVSATTGEANEPGNDSRTTATARSFTGLADTITVFASVDCEDDGTACPGNGDMWDYYIVTRPGGDTGAKSIRAIVEWFGNGTGGQGTVGYGNDPADPDLDVLVCFNVTISCTYNASDATGFSGAGLSQPEIASTTTTTTNSQFLVRVFGYVTPSPITYKMRVLRF